MTSLLINFLRCLLCSFCFLAPFFLLSLSFHPSLFHSPLHCTFSHYILAQPKLFDSLIPFRFLCNPLCTILSICPSLLFLHYSFNQSSHLHSLLIPDIAFPPFFIIFLFLSLSPPLSPFLSLLPAPPPLPSSLSPSLHSPLSPPPPFAHVHSPHSTCRHLF